MIEAEREEKVRGRKKSEREGEEKVADGEVPRLTVTASRPAVIGTRYLGTEISALEQCIPHVHSTSNLQERTDYRAQKGVLSG